MWESSHNTNNLQICKTSVPKYYCKFDSQKKLMEYKGYLNYCSSNKSLKGFVKNSQQTWKGWGEIVYFNPVKIKIYTGNFGERVTYGQRHCCNGDVYCGSFCNWSLCGFGEMKYSNGDVYTGY
jgi:hypothetical protein